MLLGSYLAMCICDQMASYVKKGHNSYTKLASYASSKFQIMQIDLYYKANLQIKITFKNT